VVELDRMTIEEAGPNPERLAAAIHEQLNHKGGAVPVYEIAKALDIVEIREAPLKRLEGAVVTTPDRDVGSILINNASPPRRRRFTLAHELGHFLNPWHQPSDPSRGFSCSRADMSVGWKRRSALISRRVNQEIEANPFAIELLAPPQLMHPYLRGVPDLAQVLRLAIVLDLSREAVARRYVEMLEQPTALIFSVDDVVRYVERHPEFPFVACEHGQRSPALPSPTDETGLSAHEEANQSDWLARPASGSLVEQTLSQRAGYSITLLAFDTTEGDDEGNE
jgi:Zn-dependent peptidase ImmA (M78 family)